MIYYVQNVRPIFGILVLYVFMILAIFCDFGYLISN